MLFNSWQFAIFMPLVFLLHWVLFNQSTKVRNCFLLGASYFFYGFWDPRFLVLILFSTLVDYALALEMARTPKPAKRKRLLWISLGTNLGLLGVFKYMGFFVESFNVLLEASPWNLQLRGIELVLPVGISFYTFQTLSYTLDVYRGKMAPTRDFLSFATYVAFFPQLVAGPIERAAHLLPQFHAPSSFDEKTARTGLRLILWGLFKKCVIADNAALFVNEIFATPGHYPGYILIAGAVFFSFQIYGDFSGYSDIAIGAAKLLGFDLMQNFATPYFSRDIAEFWRRWHISLSTWFRDYLYIPLGGSRGNRGQIVRNIFIVFLVSGLWHGANWTFVIWGLFHALLFLPLILRTRHRDHLHTVASGNIFPTLREMASMCLTFATVSMSWILFRAESLSHARDYGRGIFTQSWGNLPALSRPGPTAGTGIMIVGLVMFEWWAREHPHTLDAIAIWPKPYRWATYVFLVFLIGMFIETGATPFIYFQF